MCSWGAPSRPPPQNGTNYEFRPLETRFAPILGGMTKRGQTTRRGGCQVTIVRQPVLGGHGVRWSGWGSARWGRTAMRNGRPRFGGFNVCRSLPVSHTVRQTKAPRVIKPLTERDLGATQQQRLAATTRPGSPSFFSVFVCASAAAAAADGERHRQQGTSRRQQHGHGRTRTGYR